MAFIIVQQRTEHDSAIAALSMYTNRSYESVETDLEALARTNLYELDTHKEEVRLDVVCAYLHSINHNIRINTAQQFNIAKPAILLLRVDDDVRYVFYNGQYVIDPRIFKPDEQWFDPTCLSRSLRMLSIAIQ